MRQGKEISSLVLIIIEIMKGCSLQDSAPDYGWINNETLEAFRGVVRVGQWVQLHPSILR